MLSLLTGIDEEVEELVSAFQKRLSTGASVDRLRNPEVTDWDSVVRDGWLDVGDVELVTRNVGSGENRTLTTLVALAAEAGSSLAGSAFINNAYLIPNLLGRPVGGDTRLGVLLEPVGVESSSGSTIRMAYGMEPDFALYANEKAGIQTLEKSQCDVTPELGLPSTARIHLNGAQGESSTHEPYGERTQRVALVLHSAAMIGLASEAITRTVEFAKTREQFGTPIAAFQAVQHGLAGAAAGVSAASAVVRYATQWTTRENAIRAQLTSCLAAQVAVEAMIQYHGGIAMTEEHDAHLFAKTALLESRRFGGTEAGALELGRTYLLEDEHGED